MKSGGQSGSNRPLYLEIRDKLIDRIRRWEWQPGERIPTEPKLAEQYGVGNGTARQAVSELENDKLVVRIQGYGTFIYEHTPDDIMVRFFGFYDAEHELIEPKSDKPRRERGRATPVERVELRLGSKANVIRISRMRTRKGKPFIVENISLPETVFPGLTDSEEIPNTLYDFYQKNHRVMVVRIDERLSAVAADRVTGKSLGVAPGAPLLKIERVAFAVDGAPVEWRVRLCQLDDAYYRAIRK